MSNDAWQSEFLLCHTNLDLNGFMLGSMLNFGVFMEHWSSILMTDSDFVAGLLKMDLEHDTRKMTISFTAGVRELRFTIIS